MTTQDPASTPTEGLNPQQMEAVSHFEGPILVLAGAGSGKTRVLTVRICHLIQHHGVTPDRILAVTFTNKAAQEMRSRIRRMLGHEPAGMWMGTFHSMGARLLRRHAPQLGWSHTFTIFDAERIGCARNGPMRTQVVERRPRQFPAGRANRPQRS